jgi:antitoxin MazE
MLTKVQKWGNSLALRIPKTFAEEMQIAADSAVELTVEDGKLVITPAAGKAISLEDLLDAVTADNLHSEIDWGVPVGKEVW